MRIKGIGLIAVAALLLVTAAVGAGYAAENSKRDAAHKGDQGTKIRLSEWAKKYPLQYNSYAQLKTKSWTNTYEGHYSLIYKMFAPVLRDGNNVILSLSKELIVSGLTYDENTNQWVVNSDKYSVFRTKSGDVKGCYSCKSSNYEQLHATYGERMAAEKVDQEFLNKLNGQVWDCYLCHTNNPEKGSDATITMFREIAGDVYQKLSAKERVCGQCHNITYHKPMFESGIPWKDYQPFKYGFDADSMYKAAKESGYGAFDKETGITVHRTNHAELEFTQGSAHRSLGITCIECHMPKSADEKTGNKYTNHNASGSPLENKDALNYCLSCHTSRGINSTEEMVKMVKALQQQTIDADAALDVKLKKLLSLIKDATAKNSLDKGKLDQVREMYSKARWYREWGTWGNGASSVKVVHNPALAKDVKKRSDKTIDDALEVFR